MLLFLMYSRRSLNAWPRNRCYDMQLASICTTTCNGMFSDAVYILILIAMSFALVSYVEASFIVN